MTDNQTSQAALRLKTGRVVGAAIFLGMVGGLLTIASAIMTGSVLVGAVRRWVAQKEAPPGALARQGWSRARAATAAGVGAWRDGQPATMAQGQPSAQSPSM